jgi:polysaccharide pyruvyl transferase WcaK-like protein
MHTGIFGLSQAVPAVLISYQPKATGTMALFDLEQYCPDISTVTADELLTLVRQMIEQRSKLAQHITARLAEVRSLVQDWSHWLEAES